MLKDLYMKATEICYDFNFNDCFDYHAKVNVRFFSNKKTIVSMVVTDCKTGLPKFNESFCNTEPDEFMEIQYYKFKSILEELKND